MTAQFALFGDGNRSAPAATREHATRARQLLLVTRGTSELLRHREMSLGAEHVLAYLRDADDERRLIGGQFAVVLTRQAPPLRSSLRG